MKADTLRGGYVRRSGLRATGLNTGGYVSGGEVTGSIALRDLAGLAAVPGVVRITKQPEVHINER